MKKYTLRILAATALFGLFSVPVFADTPVTLSNGLTITAPFSFGRNLALGSTGSDVTQLQALLNKDASTAVAVAPRTGSAGHETSAFGPATLGAVKAFQKKNGIEPTGFVGTLTLAALNTALAAQHPTMPAVTGIKADTSVAGTAVITATYDGGGEKPTVWYAYGATPSSMTILSQQSVSDKVIGSSQVTISNLGTGDCYAQVFVKNSVGTTQSEAVHCTK